MTTTLAMLSRKHARACRAAETNPWSDATARRATSLERRDPLGDNAACAAISLTVSLAAQPAAAVSDRGREP
jgi:hypothetical protein